MTPPAGSATPGSVIDERYTIESLVGWGGQACVYRAIDKRSNNVVALKMVRSDLKGDDLAGAISALAWEGRLLQRLRHQALPYTVQVRQTEDSAFIARELVEGRTLAEVSRGKPCDPQIVLSWAIQLCDLLSYLHSQKPPVICGDIKPRNIVLRPNGQLCLIDLGAAQTLTKKPPKVTRPRHGTPGYAAPEQLGAWGGDERSDLFSLAVTCYELLTGIDPSNAPLQFDLDALVQHARSYAAPLRWALELEQEKRPPTAATLRSALGAPQAARPLLLASIFRIDTTQDLVRAVSQHTILLEAALASGAVEQWFATHPDLQIGKLLHDWRAALKRNTKRLKAYKLLEILAPAEGAPNIAFWPSELDMGDLPLRRWKTWLKGKRLTLRNTAITPLRWELEASSSRNVELRFLVDGKAQKNLDGTLLPGESVELEVVGAGKAGKHTGKLTLRCGAYITDIPWSGEVKVGLPLGSRIVETLEQIDIQQSDLLPQLDKLLLNGVLERWLDGQGLRVFGDAIRAMQLTGEPSLLQRRLFISSLLHERDPWVFPRLRIAPAAWDGQLLTAGQMAQTYISIENIGTLSAKIKTVSHCPWAKVLDEVIHLEAGDHISQLVTLYPPRNLEVGRHEIPIEIRGIALSFPVKFDIPVSAPRWWNQVLSWLTGN
jgi:serine/threonine protein kinase